MLSDTANREQCGVVGYRVVLSDVADREQSDVVGHSK